MPDQRFEQQPPFQTDGLRSPGRNSVTDRVARSAGPPRASANLPVVHELWRHGHDDVGYALVVTSEDDRLAQRLYEAAGFRRTEGEGGSLMLAYERDL